MRFLHPSLLFAFACMVIPVVIHFLNLRKYKKIYFSNVQFLEEIREKNKNMDQIRKWLLLIARILALSALVLAFAMPYRPSTERNQTASAGTLTGIYIDNALVMAAIGRNGPLLSEAISRAAEIIDRSGPKDRFLIVTNDFEAKNHRVLTQREAKKAVMSITASAVRRSIAEINTWQTEAMLPFKGFAKRFYWISAFQKQSGQEEKTTVVPDKDLSVNAVVLEAAPQINYAIDSLWSTVPFQKKGNTNKLVVRMRCAGYHVSKPASAPLSIKLYVNGRLKAVSSAAFNRFNTQLDTLTYQPDADSLQSVRVEINPDAMGFDDHFFASYFIKPQLNVLQINGAAPNRFVNAVFQSDAYFHLSNMNENQMDYSAFKKTHLVVLNQLVTLSSGLSSSLKDFLRKGGNVLLLPAPSATRKTFGLFLNELSADVPDTFTKSTVGFGFIAYHDALFEGVFTHYSRNPDLPRVFGYQKYALRTTNNRKVLIALQNGDPVLSSYRVGNGSFFLSSIPFDDAYTTFQRHALFLPVLYQISFYAAGRPLLFYTVGKQKEITPLDNAMDKAHEVRIKGDGTEFIPTIRYINHQPVFAIGGQIKRDGHYQFIENNRILNVMAFNYDRAASALSFYSVQELKNKIVATHGNVEVTGENDQAQVLGTAGGALMGTKDFPLWKVFIIIALILLALEEAIIYTVSRK